jgi:hypothetical protein
MSSESISGNDLAIKLGVDAGGVSRGLEMAASEARRYKKIFEDITDSNTPRANHVQSYRDQLEMDAKAQAALEKNKFLNPDRQQDSHVQDYRENQRSEAAKRYAQELKEIEQITRKVMTTQEAYAAQRQRLIHLGSVINKENGNAVLSAKDQTRAMTALTIATIRQQQAQVAIANGGAAGAQSSRNFAAAMTQASYGAEDFIQVMSMGGGLNTALMSASNNLSMVTRSLLGTSGAMASIAGFGVPLVLIGTGLLVRYLMQEADALGKVKERYEALNKTLEANGEARKRLLDHQARMEDISNMTSSSEVVSEQKSLAAKQKALDLEIKIQNGKRANMSLETRDQMFGGDVGSIGKFIATRRAEALRLESAGLQGLADATTKSTDTLQAGYTRLQHMITNGKGAEVINAAKDFNKLLAEAMIGRTGSEIPEAYDALYALLNNATELEALRGRLVDQGIKQAEIDANIKDLKAEQLSAEQRLVELKEREARAAFEVQTAHRQELLFLDQATDAQKRMYEFKKKQADEFGGSMAAALMPGMGMMGAAVMGADQATAAALLAGEIKRAQEDMLRMMPQASGHSALEQNGSNAQGKAYQQMVDAELKRGNPTVTELKKQTEYLKLLLDLQKQAPGIHVIP